MIANYITDNDLKQYHPNLTKQLWSTQATYQNQIDEAFSTIVDDLHNLGVNPRLLMTPLVLKTIGAEATSTTGTGVVANSDATIDNNYRRMVVEVTAINGTWVIELDGSTDNVTFTEVASITSTDVGIHSVTFNPQYKYYRYRSTAGTTITYGVRLVETIFDRLIIYRAFSIIFADFRKTDNDSWDLLKKDYDRKYDSAIRSVKYQYDEDEDQSTSDGEQQAVTYILTN